MSHDTRNNKVIPLEPPASVQDQAAAWLARLDGEAASASDLQEFKRWINADARHVAAFEKVAAAWDALNVLTRLPELQWQSLEPAEQASPAAAGLGFLFSMRNVAMVASLVVVVLLGLQSGVFSTRQATHATYVTAVGEQNTFTLPDDSVVQLNTNSRVQFDYRDTVRAIYLLQGEAHFTVAKNAQRPFEVYVGAGRVRAVGTAFSVALGDVNNEVNVLVTEGVVEVASEWVPPPASPEEAVVRDHLPDAHQNTELSQRVSVGNAVQFDQQRVHAVRAVDRGEMQRLLAWQKGLLIFNGEPLVDVIAEISRYTETKIVIQSKEARALRIGGQFHLGDTAAMFSALERGFGLHVEHISPDLVYLSYAHGRNEKIKLQ